MIKKVILGVILLFIALVAAVLLQTVEPGQKNFHSTRYIFPDTLEQMSFDIDSLKEVVGTNKGLAEGFELASLLAYAAYPELKDVKIDMIMTLEGAPMESNFELITLFGPKEDRVYQVLLNDATNTPYDEILLRSLPFDAQVGILAHELGHVAYYHRLSTLQIGKWGIMYLLSSDFRATHERTTDLMPVYHGLGSQIYQYAYYVRHDPSCKPLYESFGPEFIDKFYMTDKELLDFMRDSGYSL